MFGQVKLRTILKVSGVLMLQGDDGLRNLVFNDYEVALIEAVDELAYAVKDHAVQHGLFGVELDGVSRWFLLRDSSS
jgi:hypothetical protein